MRPPLQPRDSVSQSTSCCSDRLTSLPVFTKFAPSSVAAAANAQHEPQEPWFLMGVTAPFFLQSTSSSKEVSFWGLALTGLRLQLHSLDAANSVFVMSAKGLMPTVKE